MQLVISKRIAEIIILFFVAFQVPRNVVSVHFLCGCKLCTVFAWFWFVDGFFSHYS